MALQLRRKTHEPVNFKVKSEKKIFFYCLGIILLLYCLGCNKIDLANQDSKIVDKEIELLHSQIKSEDYEQIYQNSSEKIKKCLTKYQFADRMKDAVQKLKEVDKDLNFRIDEFGYEVAFEDKYNKNDYVKFWAVGSRDTQEAVEATLWDSSNKLMKYSVMKDQNWVNIPEDSNCKNN